MKLKMALDSMLKWVLRLPLVVAQLNFHVQLERQQKMVMIEAEAHAEWHHSPEDLLGPVDLFPCLWTCYPLVLPARASWGPHRLHQRRLHVSDKATKARMGLRFLRHLVGHRSVWSCMRPASLRT